MAFVNKASEIERRHYAIESYIAAGGELLPDDPMPDITYERNAFIGKERWIYRLKHDLQPTAKDWMIVRDLPPEQVRDWEREQIEQSERAIDALVAAKNADVKRDEDKITPLDLHESEVRRLINVAQKPAWMDREAAPEDKATFAARMLAAINPLNWFGGGK